MAEYDANWIAWNEPRYQIKTRWFSHPLQHAIYRGLLGDYSVNGPLDNDDEHLRAIVLMAGQEFDADWARYWPKIRERFFRLKDGKLYNKRMDEELEKKRALTQPNHARQSEAGKRGAKIRWERQRAMAAGQSPPPTAETIDDGIVDVAVRAYQMAAAQLGLPAAAIVNADRRRKLKARLVDCGGIAGWNSAIEKLRSNKFLQGEGTKNGWKADFDWLIDAKNFTSLMEGKYDRKNSSQTKREAHRAAIVASLRGVATGPAGSGEDNQGPDCGGLSESEYEPRQGE